MPSCDVSPSVREQVMTEADPTVFGIRLSVCTMDAVVAKLREPASDARALPLFTLNVAHVSSLRRDPAFRQAYRSAWLATVDGTPILLYSRLKGLRLHKVAGSDLMIELFRTPVVGMRPFFVAGSQETARGIHARLCAQGFAAGELAFDVPPFGFERDEAYSRSLAARIEAHGTTHLFMGVGAPKSEIWVVRWQNELGGCFALCVGAGLDYLAGTKRRAPALMQATGLEWAWRLWAEPRRLAKRYLTDAFAFLYIVAFRRLDLQARETSGE